MKHWAAIIVTVLAMPVLGLMIVGWLKLTAMGGKVHKWLCGK
jgi:hypothetical protein